MGFLVRIFLLANGSKILVGQSGRREELIVSLKGLLAETVRYAPLLHLPILVKVP
jgi:hypothetical protein